MERAALEPRLKGRNTMPSDIDPKSGFRLPLPDRDALDDVGKAAYDEASTPGLSIAGLQGPAGIQLYSTKSLPHMRGLTRYLRREAGFSPYLRELAILVVAREMDAQVQWTMHETEALKFGVDPQVIEIIRDRKSTQGLTETDAAVIELGRQTFGDHKVTPETFARAKAVFGPNSLIDLLLLMGNAVSSAGLMIACNLQLHADRTPRLPIP
jgi:4-carboxymuconolactone decarboxylase